MKRFLLVRKIVVNRDVRYLCMRGIVGAGTRATLLRDAVSNAEVFNSGPQFGLRSKSGNTDLDESDGSYRSTLRGVILWSSITIIALIVVESHAAVADLFSKNAILLNEIFDDSLLTLVEPAGDGNDEK